MNSSEKISLAGYGDGRCVSRSLHRSSPDFLTKEQVSRSVLRTDVDLAIRDFQRMRRIMDFGQDVQIKIGRVLYELQTLRRQLA